MRPVRRSRVPVPIVGPSAPLRSLDVSGQETINLYPETNPENTERVALLASSGYETLASLTGNGHGLGVLNGVLYAFVGEDVHRVESGFSTTNIGTIAGMSRVRTAANGMQLAVAARNVAEGYYVDATNEPNTVTEITDTDFFAEGGDEAVADVAFLNQRIIWLNGQNAEFQWSDLLDAAAYDGLNVATAEGQPDRATALMSDGRQLFVGGTDTIETFYNDSDGGFTRVPQAVATKGVAARDTLLLFDNAPTFLGSTINGGLAVYRLIDGFNVQRISTNAVDTALSGYDNPEMAFAFSFFEDGHDNYVLTFPGQATWVYDAATQFWHRRRSYGRDDWKVVDVKDIYGKLVGLLEDGNLVEIKRDAYEEEGEPIERIRVSPPFSRGGNRFTVHMLELECETGGTSSTSPVVMEMALSRDRGRTYTPWKKASIGRQGQYQKRVFWTQLGSFRDVVVKFRQTSDAPAAWIRAWADVEDMRS